MTDQGPVSESDGAVRVVVTPCQSSYFAGEKFSVAITFTNTHTSESTPVKTSSHFHKRNSHSVSSAPMARPPTSPGTPRATAFLTPSRAQSAEKMERKNLVGKSRSPSTLPDLLGLRRKKLLGNSLSMVVSPQELLGLKETNPPLPSLHSYDDTLPRSNAGPSGHRTVDQTLLANPRSLPLSPNHPHARKQSVADGVIIEDMPNSGIVSSSPSLISPLSSTYSLALDPISESGVSTSTLPSTTSTVQSSPVTPSSSTYPQSNGHPYATRGLLRTHKPSQLGMGHPNATSLQVPRLAHSGPLPHSRTELILYSYAQLVGTVSLSPLPDSRTTPEQTSRLQELRSGLTHRTVLGGGSMDLSHLHQDFQRHSPQLRVSSFSTGLFSLLSPLAPAPTSPSPWSPSHRRPRTTSAGSMSSWIPSLPGSFPNGIASPNGVGLGITNDGFDPDATLPTFECQPTMLAVDLALVPGDSQSYTYTMTLPDNLPPTFKGRSLRFSYELVVGTCRAGGTNSGSITRVMKVPIRMYTNVSVGRPLRTYDLMWPVTQRKKPVANSNLVNGKAAALRSTAETQQGSLKDLQEYSKRLLAGFPLPGANGVRSQLSSAAAEQNSEEVEQESSGSLSGCREAVEILTRNPKKTSYDVNKDGVKVAILTFTKSAYRLGETVLGIVELNSRQSRARVLQLSAILEAHESLPSSLAPQTASRQLRRIHAEHHSSFVLSTLRTTFALDIPSDASPAFLVQMDDDRDPTGGGKPGGLEWKVRLCLLVSVAAESSSMGTEGIRMKSLFREGTRGEWGSSWRASAQVAPLELRDTPRVPTDSKPAASRSWTSFFASPFLGDSERTYLDGFDEASGGNAYDGIKTNPNGGVGIGVDFGGGEAGWSVVRLETVECEIAIKVWPGNTAFKATDVVFDV